MAVVLIGLYWVGGQKIAGFTGLLMSCGTSREFSEGIHGEQPIPEVQSDSVKPGQT